MTKYFLFLAVLLIPVASVYAQQPQNLTNTTSTITIAPANETIVAGPNTTVLFSANSTGFDPLSQLGTLMMVGQVMNTGNESSENTNVTTELLDFNGTLVGFNTVPTVPSTIEPNGTANFQTTFSDLDVIGGTGNVLFYQNAPDNGGDTGKFLGFVPPPFLGFGAGAALMGAGVPLGPGGGFAPAAGGGGFGFTGGGGSGGGGGGGTTITHVTNIIKQCVQNQANVANDVGGDVGQSNRAICNIDGIIIQLPEPTTIPITLPPSVSTPTAGEPGGAPLDGKCNDGQEPVDDKCPPALVTAMIAPEDCTVELVDGVCPTTGGPATSLLQGQQQGAQLQEEDPCLSDDPPDDCPDEPQQSTALQQNTATQDQVQDPDQDNTAAAPADQPQQDEEDENE